MLTLNCKGRILLAERPLGMGIINSTPDSCFEGSRFMDETALIRHAEQLLQDGADILDIGGQSPRPGAEQVGSEEESRRVVSAIALLHRHFPGALLSVDTWYARVAREAVAAGASIGNDISRGLLDPEIRDTLRPLGVPY